MSFASSSLSSISRIALLISSLLIFSLKRQKNPIISLKELTDHQEPPAQDFLQVLLFPREPNFEVQLREDGAKDGFHPAGRFKHYNEAQYGENANFVLILQELRGFC